MGHPIHVMLVHFPAGLLPFGFVMDFCARIFDEPSFAAAAVYSYAGGVLLGSVAAVFGSMDYFRLSSDHSGWRTASLHALLNVVWIFSFAFIAGMRIGDYPHFRIATEIQLLVSGISVLGMIVSNYLGGDLVVRHGIGSLHNTRD